MRIQQRLPIPPFLISAPVRCADGWHLAASTRADAGGFECQPRKLETRKKEEKLMRQARVRVAPALTIACREKNIVNLRPVLKANMVPMKRLSQGQRAIAILIQVVQALALLILLFFILRSRPYPVEDDWHLVKPLGFSNPGEFVSWLFEQHVDHRIPMQRLIQFSLAQFSGYDMRMLMSANSILALASSSLLIRAAFLLRGSPSIGDAMIALILLTPAAGYSLWSVHLTFLSSVFMVSVVIYALSRYQVFGRRRDAAAASIGLTLLPLCGMNGAIFSTVISCGGLAVLISKQRAGKLSNPKVLALAIIPIVMNLIIWLSWKRIDLPTPRGDLKQTFTALIQLLPAQMFAFASSGAAWKALVIFSLTTAALITLARRLRRRQISLAEIALGLVIIASLAISLAVITGRGISPDLIFHYGNLMVLLPIAAWLVLSKQGASLAVHSLAAGLLVLFFTAYITNLEWRAGLTLYKQNEIAQVTYALRHEADPSRAIDKFKDEFVTAQSEPLASQQRRWAIDSMTVLKSKGFFRESP